MAGEMKLSIGGKEVLIDDSDFELVSEYKWRLDSHGYVVHQKSKDQGRKIIFMHRLILGLTDPKIHGDHINHNPRDNRRCNLRQATPQQNQFNKSVQSGRKYRGVTHQRYSCKYGSYDYIKAKIRVNGKLLHIGTFQNEEDAALAYNEAAKKYFGEFANLNVL